MRVLKSAMALIALILLSSCSTTNYYDGMVQSWKGSQASELKARWGAPNNTLISGQNLSTYVYTTQTERGFPSPVMPRYTTTVVGGRPVVAEAPSIGTNDIIVWKCTTLFDIDATGVIVNTSYHGNNCYADALFRDQFSKPQKH